MKCALVTLDLHNQQIYHAVHSRGSAAQTCYHTNTVRGSALPLRAKFMTCRAESTSRGLWREKPTRCYTMVYWTYNPLNMFPALLCPSSGARDYTGGYSMWHITCCSATSLNSDAEPTAPHQTTQPALNKVLCATCCNHLYSLELLMMGIIVPETCWVDYKFSKPLFGNYLAFLSTCHRRCTVKHSSNL